MRSRRNAPEADPSVLTMLRSPGMTQAGPPRRPHQHAQARAAARVRAPAGPGGSPFMGYLNFRVAIPQSEHAFSALAAVSRTGFAKVDTV